MTRKLTIKCPSVPLGDRSRKDYVSKTYHIEVITPIFGGGVEKGQVDVTNPIRGTAIRGHLRFWWRATKGATFETCSDLRSRESLLWGDTKNPGKVFVDVVVKNAGRVKPCATVNDRGHPVFSPPVLGYALFPFQGNSRNHVLPSNCIEGVVFSLKVDCPLVLQDDVLTALSAWCNFGGIGSRTRRGCGALYCEELAKSKQEVAGMIPQQFNDEWPTLGLPYFRDNAPTAVQAWTYAIDCLREFRQGEDLGRNPGQQPHRPGRSRWPEPDAIRRATRTHDPIHAPDTAKPDGYPRAEFGMPIITHFQSKQDPQDTDVVPLEGERFGSPLILRPIKFRDSRTFTAMALILNGPRPQQVRLMQGGRKVATAQVKGNYKYPNSPMPSLESALDAFVKYLKDSRRFEGVAR